MSAREMNEEAPSASKENDQQSVAAAPASIVSKRRHRSGPDVYWKRYCTRDGKNLICLCCSKTLSYANCSSTSFKKHLSAAHGIFDPNIHDAAALSSNVSQKIKKNGRTMRMADLKVVQEMCCNMVFKDRLPLDFWKREGATEFLRLAFPACSPPHPTIVKGQLIKAYNHALSKLTESLSVTVRVSLSVDYWRCQCPHSYLATTVHYLNSQEELESHLLDFKRFTGTQTAEKLSLTIASVLDQFSLRNKVQRVTTGLEKDIVKAVRLLGLAHLPCFAQVLHVVVNRGLKLWPDPGDTAESTRHMFATEESNSLASQSIGNPLDLPWSNEHCGETSWLLDSCEERFIETGYSEETESHTDGSLEDDAMTRQCLDTCLSCLQKCRKIALLLLPSPEQQAPFNCHSILGSEASWKDLNGKPIGSLPVDVRYSWCSTVNMIGAFLNNRQILDKYFAKMRESESVEDRLVGCTLTDEEWNVLGDLQNVLLPFLSAVNVLSAFRYPTVGLAVMCEQQLKKFCLSHNQSDSKLLRTLKSNLQRQFEKHYDGGSAIEDDLLKEIAYLNPSFHGHMSQADFLSARHVVHRNLTVFIQQTNGPSVAKPVPSETHGEQHLFNPWYFRTANGRDRSVTAALNQQPVTTGSIDAKTNSGSEVAEQMASEQLDTYEVIADRLEHQGISGRDFLPAFKQYASLRMSIPALSMPSEQAFSASGYLQRKELAANNVVGLEMMAFVCEP